MFSNFYIFDAFFIVMIAVIAIAVIVTLIPKFIKDMRSEYKMNSIRNKSNRNTFKNRRNTGEMAVRNK